MNIAFGHRPTAAAPAPGPGTGLIVDRVGKSFRGRQVVKGVSLHLNRGEVAGLLGPNGAGKTTCFYMITGLIAADYGAIWLDGDDITNQPMYQRARQGLGYLPQETSIFRGMTVEQNIMAVVEMREGRRERVAGDRRHPRGYRLSAGPRHRHPDHGPQRSRDPGHHRSSLDHPRGRGAVRGHSGRNPGRPRGPPGLPGRPIQLSLTPNRRGRVDMSCEFKLQVSTWPSARLCAAG